jgi:ribonuclease HII
VERTESRPAKARAGEGRRLAVLLKRERQLWAEGLDHVAGVDEVGCGPLAGPVVAAAVVFPKGAGVRGVDDSKRLTPARRAELAEEIRATCTVWAVACVASDEIDRINIYRAALEAMRQAVRALATAPQHVLVDARTITGVEDIPQEAIIKGDARCHAIAAASILAKTARDLMMTENEVRYPGYGFAEHKGYGTKEHREAIRRLGPCEIHRRSFMLFGQSKLWEWAPEALSSEIEDEPPS